MKNDYSNMKSMETTVLREEIDLKELFFAFKKRLFFIFLFACAGGGVGFFISKKVLKPVYTSTSVVYIMSKENALTQLTDLQIGTQLTQDYKVLITSRTVMQNTVDKLNLGINYIQLKKKIRITNPENTRILNISVEDKDPAMAKKLADEISRNASEYIADIMEQDPPKIVETGNIPIYMTKPNTRTNTALGVLFGALFMMCVITIKTLNDDTIKNEDDVDRYLKIPVLAVVPYQKHDRKKEGNIKEISRERSRIQRTNTDRKQKNLFKDDFYENEGIRKNSGSVYEDNFENKREVKKANTVTIVDGDSEYTDKGAYGT